ncbi:MAG: hypothetical protein U1E02_28065, partial [Hydrogenophaga sp.]|nr:hypothetical protein [Hydrogenophaga sp.]
EPGAFQGYFGRIVLADARKAGVIRQNGVSAPVSAPHVAFCRQRNPHASINHWNKVGDRYRIQNVPWPGPINA